MAIRTYDFIFGQKTTDYHTKSIFKDRETKEEMKTPGEFLNYIKSELDVMTSQSTFELDPDAEVCISNIKKAIHDYNVGPEDEYEAKIADIRELLATLRYVGYNLFLFERQDLETDTEYAFINAYCYYADSDIIPNITSVAEAWGITANESDSPNFATIIMGFIDNPIKISDISSDITDIKSLITKYEGLRKVNSEYMFDATPIINYVNELGYKFQIIY